MYGHFWGAWKWIGTCTITQQLLWSKLFCAHVFNINPFISPSTGTILFSLEMWLQLSSECVLVNNLIEEMLCVSEIVSASLWTLKLWEHIVLTPEQLNPVPYCIVHSRTLMFPPLRQCNQWTRRIVTLITSHLPNIFMLNKVFEKHVVLTLQKLKFESNGPLHEKWEVR